jgi:hypothetical protein
MSSRIVVLNASSESGEPRVVVDEISPLHSSCLDPSAGYGLLTSPLAILDPIPAVTSPARVKTRDRAYFLIAMESAADNW